MIAANGEVYQMTTLQWILTILSCGYYYCKYVHHLKYDRSALILTNKRIIDLDIYQRSGTVPSNLANFSVKMRSFLPGDINSGYILSNNKKHLTASILCGGGNFLFGKISQKNIALINKLSQ